MLKTYDYTCDKCGRFEERIVHYANRDDERWCLAEVGEPKPLSCAQLHLAQELCGGRMIRDEISRGRGILRPNGGYKFGFVRENGERIPLKKGRTE